MSTVAAVAPQRQPQVDMTAANSRHPTTSARTRPLLLWQSMKQFLLPRSLQSNRDRNDRGVQQQPNQQQHEENYNNIATATTPKVPERYSNNSVTVAKPQVYVVGSPSPNSPYLRIAHISDTCNLADFGSKYIYDADVIVHCGNLCPSRLRRHLFDRQAEFLSQLAAINEFFSAMPHRYKIFVPGPNEAAFLEADDRERIQALLPNCIYLRDSGCLIEGVRFHGVARGSSVGRFSRSASAEARIAWHSVPDKVDVLISHSMPANSLYEDLVSRLKPKLLLYSGRLQRSSRSEQTSTSSYGSSAASGASAAAAAELAGVSVTAGPAENCVKFKDSVIFANGHAGNGPNCRRGVFDFYAEESAPRITVLPEVSPEAAAAAASGSLLLATGRRRHSGGLLGCMTS